MKFSAAKAAVDKEWENVGENFGEEPDESQRSETGDWWSNDVGRKSSFRLTDGHMAF